MNEESKAVNSAAVKPEEIGQEEDTDMLDASEAKRFRRLAATLNYMSSDRSDVQWCFGRKRVGQRLSKVRPRALCVQNRFRTDHALSRDGASLGRRVHQSRCVKTRP